MAAECAGPDWQLGQRSYALLPNGVVLIAVSDPAQPNTELLAIHTPSGRRTALGHPFASLSGLSVVRTHRTRHAGS